MRSIYFVIIIIIIILFDLRFRRNIANLPKSINHNENIP